MATKKEIQRLLADDPEKLREALREVGYRLSRDPNDLVVKTFKIPRETAEAFYKRVGEMDLKVQDAVEEALREWIQKKE